MLKASTRSDDANIKKATIDTIAAINRSIYFKSLFPLITITIIIVPPLPLEQRIPLNLYINIYFHNPILMITKLVYL